MGPRQVRRASSNHVRCTASSLTYSPNRTPQYSASLLVVPNGREARSSAICKPGVR